MDSQRIYDICHWNWQKGRVWGAKLDFFDQLIKATGRRWAHFSALNVAKTFLLMLTCTYTRWEHMTRTHIHVKIQGQGLWMCIMGKCKNKPKSFVNNQLLAKHAKIHDSNPCTKCQKTFGAKRNLVRHLRTVHKETEADDQKEHFGKFKQLTNWFKCKHWRWQCCNWFRICWSEHLNIISWLGFKHQCDQLVLISTHCWTCHMMT